MRIFVYHPWLYLKGGCERLWLEYLSRTRHDVTLGTSYYSPETTFRGLAELPVVTVDGVVGLPNVRRSTRGLAATFASLVTARLPVSGVNRLVVSSEGFGDFVGLALPRRLPPTIAYVHTPLKIIYDPVTAALLPAVLTPRRRALYHALRPVYRAANRLAWRRYRRVIANSDEVRQRIVRNHLAAPSQVEVLHPGASPVTSTAPSPEAPFLLVGGRIMWQKRVEVAVEAQRLLAQRVPGARLVIAGGVDAKSAPYLARLCAQAAALPGIEFEPNPSDDRFAALMATCRGVVCPAPNEDWGILAVEAMASGKPVVACDAGGPRESVRHGQTGFLCEPTAEAFALGMERVWRLDEDAYSVMARRCRERGNEFSWGRFAARLDDLLERA